MINPFIVMAISFLKKAPPSELHYQSVKKIYLCLFLYYYNFHFHEKKLIDIGLFQTADFDYNKYNLSRQTNMLKKKE